MMHFPDWIHLVRGRVNGNKTASEEVDALLEVLRQLGRAAGTALDMLHSVDPLPGPPALENPTTPIEHAEAILYSAHRLYTDGPEQLFSGAADWTAEIRKAVTQAQEVLGQPTRGVGR